MKQNLKKHRAILIAYMKMKLVEGDWHAVSDAANDLRVLEERMHKIKRRI